MRNSIYAVCVGVVVVALGSSASGAITYSGDIDPGTDPATWTSGAGGTQAIIGDMAVASLNVTGGSDLATQYVTISNYFSGYPFIDSTAATVTVDGSGSTWTNSDTFSLGSQDHGTLDIKNGGKVTVGGRTCLGEYSSQYGYGTGVINVDGVGSSFNTSLFTVGDFGDAEINITDGAELFVTNVSNLGLENSSSVAVTVDGLDSKWVSSSSVVVGHHGEATLEITNGGLVAIMGTGHLEIDRHGEGGNYINMASGGMLAVFDDRNTSRLTSLSAFMGEISGSENMRYWNGSIWTALFGAALSDYSLTYMTDGFLKNYTVLQVGTAPVSGPLPGGTSVAVPSGGSSGAWSGGAGAGDNEVEVDFNGIDVAGNGALNFAAETTQVTGAQYDSLFTLATGSVSINWSFTLSRDLADGESIDLVFDLGSTDLLEEDIHLWHYDDETESYIEITGLDFSEIASGIVIANGITDFSDYTVTVVPEPATMSLLVLGGIVLIRRRRCA